MAHRSPALLAVLLLTASAARSAEFKSEKECVVGSKVTDRKGREGTIASVDRTMCRVAFPDGTSSSYLFWMLRKAGASAETDDVLVPGTYTCYTSVGSSIHYAFVDVVIDGPTSYRDRNGKGGTYRVEPSRKIVFESGPLSAMTAKLLAGPKIGLNMSGGSFFNTVCSRPKSADAEGRLSGRKR